MYSYRLQIKWDYKKILKNGVSGTTDVTVTMYHIVLRDVIEDNIYLGLEVVCKVTKYRIELSTEYEFCLSKKELLCRRAQLMKRGSVANKIVQ
jgi:hypothetical protein